MSSIGYVRFRFRDCVYELALEDYFAAREFVLTHGLFSRNLDGFINAPWHPLFARGGGLAVPETLVDDPRWHVAIVVFTGDPSILRWLESLPVPANCARSVTEAPGADQTSKAPEPNPDSRDHEA